MRENGYKGNEVRGDYSRVTFRRVNPQSADEMKSWLLSQGWEPLEWNYKKDKNGWPIKVNGEKVKTSAVLNHKDPFKGIDSKLGSIASKMFQCKHRRSLIEGLIKLIRPDGRISQKIFQVTTTMRMIHNGIVNIPGGKKFMGRHMRKCFIAKPGYKIVGTDSAGCQNRMKAARVGDPTYTKILLEGNKEDKTSIHHVNMRNLTEAGILTNPDDDVRYAQAKNLDYGMAFGSMDAGLGKQLGGDAKLGARIREVLLGVAPGLTELVDRLVKEWRSNAKRRSKWGKIEYYDGHVVGLDGRPVFIKNEKDVLVFFLQSDEAIMMSKALCILHESCEAKGWTHGVEWGLCAWVHDEFQCEVREDLIEEFKGLAEDSIRLAGEFYNISVPHQGEADVGDSWWETH
jgi:DNA polymerase I-like protein with 3'-5' exonuclease and polymerase domains